MNNQKKPILTDIVIISKYAIPHSYGISSKVYHLAKYISNLQRVTLITSNSNHLGRFPVTKKVFNFLKIEQLNIIWLKVHQYRKSKSLSRLFSWLDFEIKIRRLKFDPKHPPKVVLVSSLSILTILWGLKIKRKYGTKVVFEIRDIYPLTLTSELGVSRYNPVILLLAYIEKKGYKESDLIVGTMPLLNMHVENILGYKKDVFYSPIGLSMYYDFNRKQKLNPLTLPRHSRNSFIVGYSGSVGESNNLSSLIRVIKSLKENDDFYFLIIGDGDYLSSYKNDLKDCRNVMFTGRVMPEVVQDYIKSVNCLYLAVKPSIIWEFGQSMNKVLDYLISGKPIIAAYDGYPNMLNEIEGNLLIPSNNDSALLDALETVRNYDDTILKYIQEHAPMLVKEKYTYDSINKAYYERIKEIMKL